ncbi:MAG: NYN domain-containing protein [Phycisphaerales bacterium]|nr:NYN domain-containing protein [Phycisphaerales bacterium]
MSLIIDTCNVLHRTGILPPDLAGIDERSLASLLPRSRYAQYEALLVCDGGPAEERISRTEHNVRYVFGGPGTSADDLIIDLIVKSSAPKRLLIVTSDRQILASARKRRCRTLDSDTFLEQIAFDLTRRNVGDSDGMKGPGKKRSDDVEDWVRRFGVDDALTAIPSTERQIPDPPPEPEPASEQQATPPAGPPAPSEEWEALDTEELLRRYERGQDESPKDI